MSDQSSSVLARSFALGSLTLPNRVVMAPLTRMRARMPGNVPWDLNAAYYRQRAGAGLIITEATPVSPRGHGYCHTPGIHTEAQADGWTLVTDAVHGAGGRIFLQLWHVGRLSHPDLQPDGEAPEAPSALAAPGQSPVAPGVFKDHTVPRALSVDGIARVIGEFRRGAALARRAGFDGVEIHGANGYLIEQFLSEFTNVRTDRYGGSLENRTRFLVEVIEAVLQEWPADRVGLRLSPANTFGGMEFADRWATFSHVVRTVARYDLAYLHLVEPRVSGNRDVEPHFDLQSGRFRPLLSPRSALISAGGHNRASAETLIAEGQADLVAFGRLFIANPDLPERFFRAAELNAYDRQTFYGGGARGYTDYPFLGAVEVAE